MQLDTHEKIIMNTDQLDNGSIVVNFDLCDIEEDEVTQQGGYAQIIQDDEKQVFSIFVFDADGDVVSETHLPFKFNPFGWRSR